MTASPADEQLSDRQLMEASVRLSVAQALLGAVESSNGSDWGQGQLESMRESLRGAMTELWRTAYAAGVQAGQQPPRGALAGKIWERQRDGWTYGPAHVLVGSGLVKPGAAFVYGGPDAAEPTVSRPAMLTASQGALTLNFLDSGGRVKLAGAFWAKAGAVTGD